jgi:hypothetical protein
MDPSGRDLRFAAVLTRQTAPTPVPGDRDTLNDKPFHAGPAVRYGWPCVHLLSGFAGEKVLRQGGAGQLVAH